MASSFRRYSPVSRAPYPQFTAQARPKHRFMRTEQAGMGGEGEDGPLLRGVGESEKVVESPECGQGGGARVLGRSLPIAAAARIDGLPGDEEMQKKIAPGEGGGLGGHKERRRMAGQAQGQAGVGGIRVAFSGRECSPTAGNSNRTSIPFGVRSASTSGP